MITAILLIGLALGWLLIETDWLRVQLEYGACVQIIEQRKSWEEIKPTGNLNKQYPFWLRFPEHMTPLCGREWLENTMHVIPEYKMELVGVGYKTTINSNSTNALRDACRVNRNPYIKINLRKPSYNELARYAVKA